MLDRIIGDQKHLATWVLAGLTLLTSTAMTVVFWPGVGTWEVLQFALQRNLPVMNDWKSPFIAVIYWSSDDLFKSTGPIMILQQALFWSGLALLAGSTFRRLSHQVLFFLSIAILPPIWITEIMLWKEAWTLSLLSLSIGATFAYLRNRRAMFAVVSLISAILITATRHNAFILSLPSFYVISQTMADKAVSVSRNKRRKLFISVFAVLLAATFGVNWALNQKGKQRCHIWHQSLLWDLAAMSLAENQMLIPAEFRKTGQTGSLAHLANYFTYYNSDPLFFNNDAPLRLYGTAWTPCSENLPIGTLIESWLNAIIHHPGTYVHHRLIYLIHLLGIPGKSESWRGRDYYRIDSEYTARANQSPLFEIAQRNLLYETLVTGIISRGWFYMVIFLLSALGSSARASLTRTYLWCLWLAGCAYFASFAAIGSGAVMRYLVVYVILGPAILAGRWMDRTD